MSLTSILCRGAWCVTGILMLGAANAGPPAAPQVTAGAGEVKQLRFDWNYVPQANYYELWFKANDGATEVKVDDYPSWRPRATSNVSLHLLNWSQTRYRVKACNPSGCTATAPIPVPLALRDAVGFLKSPYAFPYAAFGLITKLSEDGNTLAAIDFPEEPAYPGEGPGPVAYLFKRNGSDWQLEARLVSGPLDPYRGSGVSISLSGDGNRFAILQPEEIRTNDPAGGTIRVYQRTQGQWQLDAIIAPPGEAVVEGGTLSNDGNVIDVRAVTSANLREHVYTRTTAGWTRTASFPLAGTLRPDNQCWRSTVSGNGQVYARVCVLDGTYAVEVFAAPTWARRDRIDLVALPQGHMPITAELSDDGNVFSVSIVAAYDAVTTQPRVDVYERTGGSYMRAAALSQGAWHQQASVHIPTQFGNRAHSLSSDGKILVIGDADDDGLGTGVLAPPLQPGGAALGAVYVYDRRATGWKLRNVIKYNRAPPESQRGALGSAVSLARAGKMLAVADITDSTLAPNPHSPLPIVSGNDSGAIWFY